MQIFLSVAALLLCVIAGPSHAAVSLQPGEWQTTETGVENGKPVEPKVEKECMTADESRDAAGLVEQIKTEMQEQGSQCERFDVQQSGESVTFTMKCAMGQHFLIDMTGTFTLLSPAKYIGAIKTSMKMGAVASTADKKIEAVRVGECRAK
jgi:hypothetical protein